MDPIEASKLTECADERRDLCDDNLHHPEPDPDLHENLSEQLTSDIQRDPPEAKKPRSKAQQEAFAKAQRALKEKRAQKAQQTPVKAKPVKAKTKAKAKAKSKAKVVYEVEQSESESSSSSEEEVVYVQRKKPKKRKPKQKKAPRVVYVTDSDDEDDEETYEQPQPWYTFV